MPHMGNIMERLESEVLAAIKVSLGNIGFNLPDASSVFAARNNVKMWVAVLYFVVGGAVGWVAWGYSEAIGWLVVLMVLPLMWGLARTRWQAGMLMLGYYLAGARGLPAGVGLFFGGSASFGVGVVLWGSACVLLSSPFVVLWSERVQWRPVRFLVALCVSIVPPLAFIGWVNPVGVAGVLFPGMGWIGLLLTIGVMATLVARSEKWMLLASLVVMSANLMAFVHPVGALAGWSGVDTHFSRLGSGEAGKAGQLLDAMRRVEWVKQFANTVPANSVRVLPETLLGPFGAMAEFNLMDTEARLAVRGSRVLVGAEIAEKENGRGRYFNSVMVLGAQVDKGEDRRADEGIPVPVSMWKPWSDDGAVADVWGRGGHIRVNGKRVAVLVCYEQTLTWSMLERLWAGADVLVGVSNVWWTGGKQIPRVQAQMMQVWGRLFADSVVLAANY